MGPVICLVSDRHRGAGDDEDRLVALVHAAARAGVHLIQVRERDLEARPLMRLVERCVGAVEGTEARVLVNDRFDVALAGRAHGVHLPAHGVPAHRLRRIAPPGFLIGRSVHSVAEGRSAAHEGGLDYMLLGTIFATPSKPGVTPVGLDALRSLAAAVPIPVLAIGGVRLERVADVAAAGASGFAAIGLFDTVPERLHTMTHEARRRFDTHAGVP